MGEREMVDELDAKVMMDSGWRSLGMSRRQFRGFAGARHTPHATRHTPHTCSFPIARVAIARVAIARVAIARVSAATGDLVHIKAGKQPKMIRWEQDVALFPFKLIHPHPYRRWIRWIDIVLSPGSVLAGKQDAVIPMARPGPFLPPFHSQHVGPTLSLALWQPTAAPTVPRCRSTSLP